MPLFEGFRTSAKIREVEARLRRLGHEKLALREGLALRLKELFLTLKRAEKQVESTSRAMDAARENRELNERAYRQGLTEIKEVIEAQFAESLAAASHCKARYDHAAALAGIERAVGREMFERL